MHLSHREYYRDRDTEYELCQDFPGDEILIDGLHSMQSHFYNNGVNIEIPIVRVMNTAHWLAAYMFSTECSGNQMEYEALASISCGRDRQLAIVAMIVLAAMLKRTKGFRAMQCRNVILDNRPPDFEEGVTLYDHFLRSAEERFAEEDFLIDIPALVQRNQELEYENIQLKTENRNLKCKYEFMENQQNIQYNIGTQNNYNGCTINQYYYPTSTANPPEDVEPEPAEPEPQPEPVESIIFTKKAKKEAKQAEIIEALKESTRRRRDKTRAFVKKLEEWQNAGYIDTHYNARIMYDELDKLMPLSFGYDVFKRHYNNTRV